MDKTSFCLYLKSNHPQIIKPVKDQQTPAVLNPLLNMSKAKLNFPKPSTKLENLEDSLNTPNLETEKIKLNLAKGFQLSSSGTILNPNVNINKPSMSTNAPFFESEQKILSLQRSISEKLRSSFKNKSNNITLNRQNSVKIRSNLTNNCKIEPRKWHSERVKKYSNVINKSNSSHHYNVPKASSRFSTLIPLSSHHKALLAQYAPIGSSTNSTSTNETSATKPQTQIKKLLNQKSKLKSQKKNDFDLNSEDDDDDDDDDDEDEDEQEIEAFRKFISSKENAINASSSASESESEENNNQLGRIKLLEKVDMAFDADFTDFSDDDSDVRGIIFRENGDENYYEKVGTEKRDCEICFERRYVNERSCCNFKACNKCINVYLQTKIKECCGNAKIECLNNKCSKLIHRDEINERMLRFDKNSLNLYLKVLVDANKDSNAKTCPRCSHVMTVDDKTSSGGVERQETSSQNKKLRKKRSSVKSRVKGSSNAGSILTKVQCNECQLVWCFQCHAPWHDGIACTEFKKGDRMLKYWAKEVHYGQQNAQLCPKCNIYIQRTKGCDHMVCTFCHSEFCYKCGKKFRSLRFVGDHYSKLSVLGCKYRLYPEKPVKRKIIRGSVLGAKVAVAPFVAAFGLVVGAGVLAVGCVALPVYCSYKLIQGHKVDKRRQDIDNSSDNSTINGSCSTDGVILNEFRQKLDELNFSNLSENINENDKSNESLNSHKLSSATSIVNRNEF